MASQPIYTAALVGCGRIGYSLGLDQKREQPASHTMALNENERVRLIAGCDTDSIILRTWHDANKGTSVYADSSKMYECQKPDIIVIAVNEENHITEAVNAIIARPRLVILEKPVALNVEQALKIQAAALRNRVPVMINHERRFALDYALAKNYMKKIGAIQRIRAHLASSLCVYNPQAEKSGAYSLIHDGTHLVDIVLYFLEQNNIPSRSREVSYYSGGGLFNKAMQANGITTRFVNTVLHDPCITGVLREKDGIIRQLSAHYETALCPDVTLEMSGRSRFFDFGVDILGTEGRVCVGNGYLKAFLREESSLYTGFYSLTEDTSIKPPEKTRYFANMVQNAVDFLDGTSPLGSTLQTGINALAVLDEIKAKII